MSTDTLTRGTTLHYAHEFQGIPVDQSQGPLIARHLQALHNLIQRAQAAHPDTLAVRFDLHVPNTFHTSVTLDQGNGLISLFWQELFEQFFQGSPSAPLGLRFAWSRDHPTHSGGVIYKVLALVNTRAFHGLYARTAEPDLVRSNSLAGCILRAWGQALRLPGPPPQELVSFPLDPCTGEPQSMRLSPRNGTAWQRLFTETSSLCKAEGKPLGRGFCVFRTSNR